MVESKVELFKVCCDTHEKGEYALFRIDIDGGMGAFYFVKKEGQEERVKTFEAKHDDEAMEMYAGILMEHGEENVCPTCGSLTRIVQYCPEHGVVSEPYEEAKI